MTTSAAPLDSPDRGQCPHNRSRVRGHLSPEPIPGLHAPARRHTAAVRTRLCYAEAKAVARPCLSPPPSVSRPEAVALDATGNLGLNDGGGSTPREEVGHAPALLAVESVSSTSTTTQPRVAEPAQQRAVIAARGAGGGYVPSAPERGDCCFPGQLTPCGPQTTRSQPSPDSFRSTPACGSRPRSTCAALVVVSPPEWSP
jgi:hypothetical protein